jgi:membrane-associated phospholipid phosphatase
MLQDTAGWQAASVAFFVYVLVVALTRPGMRVPARRRTGLAAGGGLLVALSSAGLPPHPVLHGWILPPLLLLLGYWTSGLLFVAPMPRVERILEGADRALRIPALAARTPRPLAELLELAYAGVYPIIPVALVLHLVYTPGGEADRFWSVVLLTDFICFGMLPWIQTRPPRAVETGEPWRSSVRALNLRILGTASIDVNTFPSGHAAEALAVTLLVLGAPWSVVAVMAVVALAISTGAVFGRYHYALDVLAGWAVALCVWMAI